MEEDGVIKRRVAVLDPVKVNAGVTVFMAVRTNEHNDAWLREFAAVVDDFPEVVEFYRMSGEVDYLLRVVVPDIAAYDAFYKKLIAHEISNVSSSFAMEQIKYTTALPLDFALRHGAGEARRRLAARRAAGGPGRPRCAQRRRAALATLKVHERPLLPARHRRQPPAPPITATMGFTLERGARGLRGVRP